MYRGSSSYGPLPTDVYRHSHATTRESGSRYLPIQPYGMLPEPLKFRVGALPFSSSSLLEVNSRSIVGAAALRRATRDIASAGRSPACGTRGHVVEGLRGSHPPDRRCSRRERPGVRPTLGAWSSPGLPRYEPGPLRSVHSGPAGAPLYRSAAVSGEDGSGASPRYPD